MRRLNLLPLLVLWLLVSSSRAEMLVLSTEDQLWTLNTRDGATQLLGTLPVGGNEILELAMAPDGSYWGVAGGTLYAIDPFAMDAQAVGPLDTLGTIAGLAFDKSGVLYGLQWNSHLYTIDPADAAADYLGQVANPGPFHTLDTDSLGRLIAPTYFIFEPDLFLEISPSTLDATLLNNAPGEISAMVFGSDDVLYAYSDTNSVLYQVDLENGTWVELFLLDQLGAVEGMELIPEPAALAAFVLAAPIIARRRSRV